MGIKSVLEKFFESIDVLERLKLAPFDVQVELVNARQVTNVVGLSSLDDVTASLNDGCSVEIGRIETQQDKRGVVLKDLSQIKILCSEVCENIVSFRGIAFPLVD